MDKKRIVQTAAAFRPDEYTVMINGQPIQRVYLILYRLIRAA